MRITCDTVANERRRTALTHYFATHVVTDDFICASYGACKASHSGIFLEGQLHHIGRYYDLHIDDVPFRVMVVGQEYGHRPARVSLAARYEMVMDSGLNHRFKAGAGYNARNPHMKGTTSALRLLFGLPLGSDYESEFLEVGTEKCHLFDAFALVNYLLCSAIGRDEKKRGLATPEMTKHCRAHFRKAIDILEPQIIIVQGDRFWSSVRAAFDSVKPLSDRSHVGYLADSSIAIASFTHPSSHYPNNWGSNDRTPYLTDVVLPTIRSIRDRVLKKTA